MKNINMTWLSCTLLAFSLFVAGCSTPSTEVITEAVAVSSNATLQSSLIGSEIFAEEDIDSSWDESSAESIDFQGDKVTTTAKRGVFVDQSDVTIALPGTYVLSGQLDNGSVQVNLEYAGEVRLILNNASIHNEDGAAIYVAEAGKTIITLAEGTTNTLSDGAEYNLEDEQDEPNGTLFSKDDLTINGSGKLVIEANYNNGIVSKDKLLIADGEYVIESVDDGVTGRDILAIRQGSFTLNTSGDALRATNDNEDQLGAIYIADGNFTIHSEADAIDSIGEILIESGSFTIQTGEGAESTDSSANSAKAIKAATDITIQKGEFDIDAADDAVHSNDSVSIYGGSFLIATKDDGFHADGVLTINDGDIDVKQSNEGLEGQQIVIHGGVVSVTSSDDGVNVSGGNDQSAFSGGGGASFNTNSDALLLITGGQVVVNAAGDGLDSNGSIEMSGGTVLVHGPEGNGNGALDYDGNFSITGGTLIAAGSSGMAMAPSEEGSTQSSILVYYPTTQSANTLMQLSNADGEVLVAFEPIKNYETILISSPHIEAGKDYTVSYGGQSELIEGIGLGIMTPSQQGTELVTFTAADRVSYVNQDGITTNQGGFGGMGGFGGGRGERGNRQGTDGATTGNPGERTLPNESTNQNQQDSVPQ